MSEKIKAVYLDSDGNQHDTRATAKKVNRLIEASKAMARSFAGVEFEAIHESAEEHNAQYFMPEFEDREILIEFARAVVSIYGMKDKAQ